MILDTAMMMLKRLVTTFPESLVFLTLAHVLGRAPLINVLESGVYVKVQRSTDSRQGIGLCLAALTDFFSRFSSPESFARCHPPTVFRAKDRSAKHQLP